jgi:hypothetical protein
MRDDGMVEEATTRVMTLSISGATATLPAADPDVNPITWDAGQWSSIYTTVAGNPMQLLYQIKTLDLSGYTLQDKTLFPTTVNFQDMDCYPQTNNMGTAVPVRRATMLSTTPISGDDLNNFSGLNWDLPGSNRSTFDLDNILFGRFQTYLQLSTFAGLQQIGQNVWGSGDATAGEKIWYVDAYLIPNIASLTFTVPNQSMVMPIVIAEEPELEYMMRLSRSLEPVY